MKKQLIKLILEKAFKYNKEPVFKLVSGRMSNYYFNCKAVTLHPEGMYLIGNIIFDMLQDSCARGIMTHPRTIRCGRHTSYWKKARRSFVVEKPQVTRTTVEKNNGGARSLS
jgi:orotate phosphoribosyltransferase